MLACTKTESTRRRCLFLAFTLFGPINHLEDRQTLSYKATACELILQHQSVICHAVDGRVHEQALIPAPLACLDGPPTAAVQSPSKRISLCPFSMRRFSRRTALVLCTSTAI